MTNEKIRLRDLQWFPYLAPAVILFLLLTGIALIAPPAAAASTSLTPPDITFPQLNISPWDPESGYYTRYWFDYEEGTWQPYAFLQSIMMPFTDLLGYWVFVILWGVYLFGVWNRERSIELTLVIMLISGTMWGLLLPPETYQYFYLCIAMGLAAVVYKLFKKGVY